MADSDFELERQAELEARLKAQVAETELAHSCKAKEARER